MADQDGVCVIFRLYAIHFDQLSSWGFLWWRGLFRWSGRTGSCNHFAELEPSSAPRSVPWVLSELRFSELSGERKRILVCSSVRGCCLLWRHSSSWRQGVPWKWVTFRWRQDTVKPVDKINRYSFVAFDKLVLQQIAVLWTFLVGLCTTAKKM